MVASLLTYLSEKEAYLSFMKLLTHPLSSSLYSMRVHGDILTIVRLGVLEEKNKNNRKMEHLEDIPNFALVPWICSIMIGFCCCFLYSHFLLLSS